MYPQDPNFKSIFMGDDSEKPSDMADDTVLSPDGVNPVSYTHLQAIRSLYPPQKYQQLYFLS